LALQPSDPLPFVLRGWHLWYASCNESEGHQSLGGKIIKREQVLIGTWNGRPEILAAPFELVGYEIDASQWQPLSDELAQDQYEQALREYRENVEMLKNSDNVNMRKMAGIMQRPTKSDLYKRDATYLFRGAYLYGSCALCGTRIVQVHRWHRFCSNTCKADHINQRRAASRPSRAKVKPAIDCGHCGESFTPARKDARFCSSKCRIAAHRGKK